MAEAQGGGTAKSVKLTFTIDETSFSKSMRMLQDINSQLAKIIESSQRAGQALGGAMGGGGIGMPTTVTSRTSGIGTGLATSMAASAAPSIQKMNMGLGGGVVQTLQSQKDMIKGLADISKSSLGIINDALRDSASRQVREIERIEGAIKNLTNSYDEMKQKAKDGFVGPETMKRAGAGYYSHLGTLNEQLTQARAGMRDINAMDMAVVDAEAGPGGGGSRWSKFKQFMTSPVGTSGGPGGMMGWLRGGAGIPYGAAIGAGIGLGVAGISYATGAMDKNFVSNLQYEKERPMWKYQVMSQIGNLSVKAQELRYGGDAAQARAYGQAMTAVARESLLSSGSRLQAMIDTEKSGRLDSGERKDAWWASAGGVKGAVGEWVGGIGNAGNLTPSQIEQEKLRIMRDPSLLSRVGEVAEAKMKEQAHYGAILNSVQGSAFGNVGMANMAGVGLGRSWHSVPGGYAMLSGVEAMEARAQRLGASGAELAGYRAQFMTLGPEFRPKGERYRSMMIGGVTNAVDLFGTGAQFGGGDAFMSALQGGIGGGGVGIGTGRSVAGQVAGHMTSGNFMGTGIEAMEGMLSSAFTGDPGTDLRMSRIMASGMGQYQSYMGGHDNLSRAMNVVFSAQAAPGSYQSQQLLRNLGENPVLMAQILRSGRVPLEYQRAGLNLNSFKTYRDLQTRHYLQQYIGEAAGNTPAAATARRFMAANQSMEDFAKSSLQGVRRRDQRSTLRTLIGDLAIAKMGTAPGTTFESNFGAIEAMLAADPELRPTLHGRGAHGAKVKGTVEGAVGETESGVTVEKGVEVTGRVDEIKTDIRNRPKVAEGLEALASGASLKKGTEQLESAMDAFVKALKKGAENIEKATAPGRR